MSKMITWDIEARPYKEQSRHIVAVRTRTGKQSLLVMPSNSGRDVEILLEKGIGTQTSRWLVVERTRKILRAFQASQLLPDTQTTYHCGQFHKLPLDLDCDFIWFDLCGNLTNKDVRWLQQFQPTKQLDLFFTFSNSMRGNPFFRLCREVITKNDEFIKYVLREKIKRRLCSIEEVLWPSIITQWQLLEYALPQAQIHCSVYKDSQAMMLFHMKNFGDRTLHFATKELDALVGNNVSRETVINAVLGAVTPTQVSKAKAFLKSYLAQFPNSEKKQAKEAIHAALETIRNKQELLFS